MENKNRISLSSFFLVIFIIIIIILSIIVYVVYEKNLSLEEKVASFDTQAETQLKQDNNSFTSYNNSYNNTLLKLYNENSRIYLEIPTDSETNSIIRNNNSIY